MNKNKLVVATMIVLFLMMFTAVLAQQNTTTQSVEVVDSINEESGFFTTFVKTPFVLFCLVGTITGVIFSALFEFAYNVFGGFDNGYPNTAEIWNIGWHQILKNWYWRPAVGWHVLIAVFIWSPLLKRKKSKE